jgi:hypothetical protein
VTAVVILWSDTKIISFQTDLELIMK